MSNKHQIIKEDMLERAMELWDIEEPKLVDPVIDLLLDVFSYEFAKIEQDIKISDAKLLERISKILVKESWSLPVPAHALLKAQPNDQRLEINRNTQFYHQKLVQGDTYRDLFFTPLFNHTLVNARVACIVKDKNACFYDNRGRQVRQIATNADRKITDYTAWVGIAINEKDLSEIKELPLALILRDSNLDAYLSLLTFLDVNNNELKHKPTITKSTNASEHYANTVSRYYKNYLHTILLNEDKTTTKFSTKFKSYFTEEEVEAIDDDLFWIKINFPVVFNPKELEKLSISLNTFPVVNRRLQYKQHSLERNGKIASLQTINELFLNIESVVDNAGRQYLNTLTNDINNIKGSYSLYFGELEQFDERNAKAVLERVIQMVREEGSSFSAVGYDLLNAYLDELNERLNVLERKVNVGYKNVSNNNDRQYLLVIPHNDASHLECQFWTTDADAANGITQDTLIGQFQSNDFIGSSIRLQTDTVGGNVKNNAKEKISNMRYGLLSRDRIVSKEDVKEFVKKSIGKNVEAVRVKPGVGISNSPKGGLIRTTQVEITLTDSAKLTSENKQRLSNALVQELEQKSVQNLPYSVLIQ